MMKKFILFISISLTVFSIYSSDIKFPGKIGLEYKILFYSDINDGKPMESVDAGSGELYIGNEFKGNVKFRPTKFYSITPWLLDKVEMKYYYSGTADQPDLKIRNRFYFGLDNIFIIPKALSIGVNYELRLESSLQYNRIELRHTPILILQGKYDFGLSFKIKNMFQFYLYPDDYINPEEDMLFQLFYFEIDKLNIQYEFFHFFSPTKKMKGSLEAELFLSAQFLTGTKRYISIVDRKPLQKLSKVEIFLGFNFDFWGINPYIGFFAIWNQYTSADGGRVDDFAEKIGITDSRPGDPGLFTQFFPGIRCGLNFVKDNMRVGFEYSGYIIAYDSYDYSSNFNDAADYSLSELYNKHSNQLYKFWENHISCYAKVKF